MIEIQTLSEILSLKNKNKIGVYKIDSNKWHDIGQWNEYRETISKLNT